MLGSAIALTDEPKPSRERVDAPPPAAVDADGPVTRVSLGHVPALLFTSCLGVLLCTGGDALSRATLGGASLLFWAGILVVVLPLAHRLSGEEATRGERLTLVVMLGLALYAVKVSRDPFGFTLPDELVHAYNADEIVRRHALFGENPILTVTPDYPGLEGATSALMTLTGLSSFGAGLIVVAAARTAMVAGLFLLFERVSGSSRVAGLAVAVYVGTPNFLLFSAQYSYESLSLPLLVAVLVVTVERETATARARTAWLIAAVLLIAAIVVTHHLTAYALVGVLVLLSAVHALLARGRRRPAAPSPWPLAAIAVVLTGAWLVKAGAGTGAYLGPVLRRAAEASLRTASGEAAPRTLFQSTNHIVTPVGERIAGVLAVGLLALAIPYGLREIWRHHRDRPLALIFAAASIGFLGAQGLRLAPAAWETGTRATDFFFIGLAFLVATVGLERWSPRGRRWPGPVLATACVGLICAGGIVAGWSYSTRLSQPLLVEAEGRTLPSAPLALARWVHAWLPGGRFAAPDPQARLINLYGDALGRTGKHPDIEDIVRTRDLPAWQVQALRGARLRYVVVDRRERSGNNVSGYFFGVHPPAGPRDELLSEAIATRFRSVRASQILDSGTIRLFDLEDVPISAIFRGVPLADSVPAAGASTSATDGRP